MRAIVYERIYADNAVRLLRPTAPPTLSHWAYFLFVSVHQIVLPHRPGVPPGARFDPFGPPGVGPSPGGRPRPRQPGEPDPDHLRMPGSDYDNMFM